MAKHFPQLNEIKQTLDNTTKGDWKEILEDRAEYPPA